MFQTWHRYLMKQTTTLRDSRPSNETFVLYLWITRNKGFVVQFYSFNTSQPLCELKLSINSTC